MKRPFPSCLGLPALLLVFPMMALAQAEPPEGCFCLAEADKQLPQVQRGCSRFPGAYYWSAICRYVGADGAVVVAPSVMVTERWTVIPAGEGECSICEPSVRALETLPRGDETEEVAE